MKEIIPSALLLFFGRVAAQENPLGLGDIIPALPSGIDPDDLGLDLDTLIGFLDGMAEGGGDGDSSNLFDVDGITDFLSDLFGGGDDSDADGDDVGGQADDAADGVDAPSTLDILGAVLSNNDINVECSDSCTDMDLCKFDLSMLTDDTDNLEQMCDAGCIPNILVNACAKTDGISDGAAITGGAVTGGVGGAAGAATAMNVCDFVTCCVNEEDVVTSTARSRFEGCKASLPDLDNLTGALAGASEGIGTESIGTEGIGEDSDLLNDLNDLLDESNEDGDLLNGLNDLLDGSNSNSETPEEDDPEESSGDLYNPPELEDPDELGLGFSTYDATSSGMTFSLASFLTLTATAIISTVLVLVI